MRTGPQPKVSDPYFGTTVMSSKEEDSAEDIVQGSEEEPEAMGLAVQVPASRRAVNSSVEGEYVEPAWSPAPVQPQTAREHVTTRYLTKYERARVLGARALQISRNAPLQVDPTGETDSLALAEMELKAGRLPFTIRRYLPDGSFEDWPVNQLLLE